MYVGIFALISRKNQPKMFCWENETTICKNEQTTPRINYNITISYAIWIRSLFFLSHSLSPANEQRKKKKFAHNILRKSTTHTPFVPSKCEQQANKRVLSTSFLIPDYFNELARYRVIWTM